MPGLLALVAAVVVGASLPGWLKDRVSHGPFSVTIDTGDRELDGMVVTLFAYAGTMHGNRATYYEQRIARSRERIEFPQQRIQWFGQPRMIVSIDHPLLTGDSYYIPGFRV
ncbi:MAG: hypothetical protein LPK85_02040, partial [Gammaproteobacteria bacterium]|nr:hypothetical protein [Gammaproteobacteria bacterium]